MILTRFLPTPAPAAIAARIRPDTPAGCAP